MRLRNGEWPFKSRLRESGKLITFMVPSVFHCVFAMGECEICVNYTAANGHRKIQVSLINCSIVERSKRNLRGRQTRIWPKAQVPHDTPIS